MDVAEGRGKSGEFALECRSVARGRGGAEIDRELMYNIRTKECGRQLSEVTDLVQLAVMQEMRQKFKIHNAKKAGMLNAASNRTEFADPESGS